MRTITAFGPQRNDLAPLSDFVVTETIHVKPNLRKVLLGDWAVWSNGDFTIDYAKSRYLVTRKKPVDIEVVLHQDMVERGWSIEWVTA